MLQCKHDIRFYNIASLGNAIDFGNLSTIEEGIMLAISVRMFIARGNQAWLFTLILLTNN